MKTISRRTVLRGLGTAIALPWMECMTGRALASNASAIAPPLRTAFFYVPNGMHMPDWTPGSVGKDFELPKIMQPLQEHRDQLNVLSGLTLNGARALGDGPGDHARSVAAFLTGAHPKKTDGKGIRNGKSIDQALAELVGDQTKLPSLEIGMEGSAHAGRCDSGYSCVYTSNISWRTDVSPVAKEVNPRALFDRLFGMPDEMKQRAASAQRNKHRQSILDFVSDETQQLQNQIGSGDRRKLDEYLYAVREVEKRIAGSDKLDQLEQDVPDYPRPKGVPREYESHMKLLFDIMVLALQTDSTRTLSFMYANAGSNRSYRNIGVKQGHHDLSHHGNNKQKQEQISKINQYHSSLFAYFLDKLAGIPDGDGVLLDNTFVMYGSGIADGNRHAHHGLPILTAGSAGGRLVTGQHIEFADETPLTNLYLTLLNQAGSDAESFGDSNGQLPELLA